MSRHRYSVVLRFGLALTVALTASLAGSVPGSAMASTSPACGDSTPAKLLPAIGTPGRFDAATRADIPTKPVIGNPDTSLASYTPAAVAKAQATKKALLTAGKLKA